AGALAAPPAQDEQLMETGSSFRKGATAATSAPATNAGALAAPPAQDEQLMETGSSFRKGATAATSAP
ncbi:hypothetical protein B9D92_21930, partial [Mycobacterium tuberculosis]